MIFSVLKIRLIKETFEPDFLELVHLIYKVIMPWNSELLYNSFFDRKLVGRSFWFWVLTLLAIGKMVSTYIFWRIYLLFSLNLNAIDWLICCWWRRRANEDCWNEDDVSFVSVSWTLSWNLRFSHFVAKYTCSIFPYIAVSYTWACGIYVTV